MLAAASGSSLIRITGIKHNNSTLALHDKNEIFHERFLQEMWGNLQFPADLVTFTEEILQSLIKGWRQIDEIKQNRFSYGMFYSWFFAIFYEITSKSGFWLGGCVLAIKPKHFRDFLEIFKFPKILSLKTFGNSWGNLYTYFLVIII